MCVCVCVCVCVCTMYCLPHAALVGYVVYPTQELQSGTLPFIAVQQPNGTFPTINGGGNLVNMSKLQCIPPLVPNGTVLTQIDAVSVYACE